jgi:hypothetical protein
MSEPDWWPRDPYGYVLLARALEKIGAAMHDQWTGTESTTDYIMPLPDDRASLWDRQRADILLHKHRPDLGRPDFVIGAAVHEFTDEHWKIARELAQRLHDKGRPALHRLHTAQTEIIRRNEAGELILKIQARNSGRWQEFQTHWWNTDKWRSRFDQCRVDPEYPNGDRPSWKDDNDHWIFVTLQSLESALKQFAGKHSNVGRKPDFDWQIIETEALSLMDQHGDFTADDPKWNAQARLEEALKDFCQRKWQREPSTTQLRSRLPRWLAAWRERKRGN